MIRYQVRNEYGLADPDLYAPEEKDDPEALLEGVAMAGLVGVLRQLGDLAEFAAEIFHDLHEDVMASAARGHGLMLRLQQLEAEFPAVEKAIVAQTDHSNYLHDDGIEWHANLQLNQNLITIGDMPRFILDSYEECRGPPHLFTLDKFDVAGAGASLKRYSDPSFFKMGQTSDMLETDYLREKNPRKIKKKAMRRKGETLESLLVANSEPQTTSSKERSSRKVPPRTTKLKPRHPQTISRICREQLQEVVSSQQKILSNYSARYYSAKFRLTDSNEIISSCGELNNFSSPPQSSAKLELTKVVPVDESGTLVTASAPINRTVFHKVDDSQFLATQHEHAEMEHTSTSGRLQGSTDFKEESNCPLQSVRGEKLQSAVVPVNHDNGRCRPDEVVSDQDNFVDAFSMESEGEAVRDMKSKRDLSAKIEESKLNYNGKEVESALHVHFSELDPATDPSSGLSNPCNGREPTRADSFLLSDSSPSAASGTKDTDSDSDSCRPLSAGSWTNNREPFNDVDLMDVSSSSSITSDDNGNFETTNNLNGCKQNKEVAFLPSSDDHATAADPTSDKQLSQISSGLDGLAISSSDYHEKAYRSAERGQNNMVDGTSTIFEQPNDVSHDGGEIRVPVADDLLLHSSTRNQEQIQLSKNQFEECTSLDTVVQGTASKLVTPLDMDPVVHMNDLQLDNIAFPEETDTSTTPASLDPNCIHKHLDDDETVEDLQYLPAEDLYKHVAEDQNIFTLEKGPCSVRLDTHREDHIQASVVPMHLSNVQAIPELTESESTLQDDTKTHVKKTLKYSPRVLDDDTKPSFVDAPPACSTAPLLGASSDCMEYGQSIEAGKSEEHGEVLVDAEAAEESVTSMFEDGRLPWGEKRADGAKYTEKAEIPAINSREENCRHDAPLQSSSPFRQDMETVEPTCGTLGSLEESRGHIFKESILQPAIFAQPIEIETSGETFSDSHDIQYVPSSHYPEESFCQEELPEETTLSAEVPFQCDLDKDVAVITNRNMVGEQPSHVDRDLLNELSAQDSFGTNPFVDPGYRVSSTDPLPSMSYQPYCSEEEQDFLSELLIQHGHTKAENQYPFNDDSLWESATPPDEAPLPSEVITEGFYHEMDFTAATEGFDDEPSSDSALLTELDQKAGCSKPDSQLAECSSASDIPGETSMSFSSREFPDGKTPGVDSGLSSHESVGDEKSPELITPSVAVKLEQERHELHGVVSDSGTGTSVDNAKIGEIYGSPSGKVAPVKEEEETCANLFPHVFINIKLDELDVHFINSLPVEPEVGARGLDELNVLPLSEPVLTQESDIPVLAELNSQTVPSSSVDKTVDDPDVPSLRSALEDWVTGDHDCQIGTSFVHEKIDELGTAPLSNDLPVEEAEVCVPSKLVSCSLPDEKIDELSCPPLSGSTFVENESEDHVSGDPDSQIALYSSVNDEIVGSGADKSVSGTDVELGWEACSSPEFDSQIAPCPLSDHEVGELDGSPSSNVQVEEKNGSYYSPEGDSRIAQYSSINDKIDGPCASTSINDIEVEEGWEACASPELDSQITPCPLSDYEVGELNGSPSSNVQVEAENGSYCSPECDSRTVPYSSVNNEIDGPCAATSINDIEVEQGWEACASPELDFQIAPWPLSEEKVGELDGPSSSSVQVEAENKSYCSPEFDSLHAPGSSNSGALAERSTMTSTSVMPEENCWHSSVPPQTKPFQNLPSEEDPQMTPPLPPLQWRLGRPRLGLMSTKDRMPDPVMRTTSLPTLSQPIDNSLGSLDRTAEPVASVSSQGTKERYQSSMEGDDDQGVESGKSSTLPTVDDVAREHDRSFSEACENIKHEGDIISSPAEADEHPNDSGVTEHLTNKQDSQQLSHTDSAMSEDEKTVDDHNAAGSVHLHIVSPSAPGNVSENGSYREPHHGESFSGTSENEGNSSNASYEQNNLKDQSITSGLPSDTTTKHIGSSSALEEGNSQESRLQEQDAENPKGGPSEGPSPSAKSLVSEDYPHGDHNLERENINQLDSSWFSNKSKHLGGLGEGSYAQAEQPPVMGWTVGPQMLHPNYGISMEGIRFEPEVTDHRLTRKPISMRNIPRNPLVDAVAAHDRSTMRKVSELAPTTDKPNSDDRNLWLEQIRNKVGTATDKSNPDDRNIWLEQIRNKTFDLKPVGSARPTSTRVPAGNLRVAAIIEKANAIRQAVGSDDEDDDNWSDT
ncbi:unnamed protein product [Alopecurus aequalis]